MPKEIDREEYLIVFGYALLALTLISEPFVFQFTSYENVRIYGYLLFLIGAIILTKILNRSSTINKVKSGDKTNGFKNKNRKL